MTTTTFSLEVSYSQMAVFVAGIDNPFNDWTDQHLAQGFSWRPESVSFMTLDEIGTLVVDVERNTPFDAAGSHALRIIRVPFTVPESGSVEVASIGGSATLRMEPGRYELTFEHGRDGGGGMWCKLHFRATADIVAAAILRADDQLQPSGELLMKAEPALSDR